MNVANVVLNVAKYCKSKYYKNIIFLQKNIQCCLYLSLFITYFVKNKLYLYRWKYKSITCSD